jgi:hypothetical protein
MKKSILLLFTIGLMGLLWPGCSTRTRTSEEYFAGRPGRAAPDRDMMATQRSNQNAPATNSSPPRAASTSSDVAESAGKALPAFIVELLRNPNRAQDLSLMTNVDPAWVDVLVNAYSSTPEFTNRGGLIRALSFIGDDRACGLFLNTLTNEMKGRVFSVRETRFATSLTVCFGILARRSDAAYRFIIDQGSWPSFWAQHRSWKRAEADELVNDQLAGGCIESLGYSERPDLDAVLEELKSRHEEGFPRQFTGAIVQAAFYQSVIRKYGFIRACDLVLWNPNTSFDEFVRWIQSPQGKSWEEWSNRAGRGGGSGTNSQSEKKGVEKEKEKGVGVE